MWDEKTNAKSIDLPGQLEMAGKQCSDKEAVSDIRGVLRSSTFICESVLNMKSSINREPTESSILIGTKSVVRRLP